MTTRRPPIPLREVWRLAYGRARQVARQPEMARSIEFARQDGGYSPRLETAMRDAAMAAIREHYDRRVNPWRRARVIRVAVALVMERHCGPRRRGDDA